MNHGRNGSIEDHIERLRRQWAKELPHLDTEAMATLGRTPRKSIVGIENDLARREELARSK